MPRISEFYGIMISLYWAERLAGGISTPGTERTEPRLTSPRSKSAPAVSPAGPCAWSVSGGKLHRAELAATWERAPALTFDDGTAGEVQLLPHWGPVSSRCEPTRRA